MKKTLLDILDRVNALKTFRPSSKKRAKVYDLFIEEILQLLDIAQTLYGKEIRQEETSQSEPDAE